MSTLPTLHRRALLGAGLLGGPLLAADRAAAAVPKSSSAAALSQADTTVSATAFEMAPSTDRDQTSALQTAIDHTSAQGLGLTLPPGIFVIGGLLLRPGTRLIGAPGATVLRYSGIGTAITADKAHGLRLEHLTIDGRDRPLDHTRVAALVQLTDCSDATIDGVHITGASANGLHFQRASGRIVNTHVSGAHNAGIWSLDADQSTGGLSISDSHVTNCRDNGILIWRGTKGEDGTRIHNVSVARIGNRSGGSGQYGNGINVFRASGVAISNSRFTDCAYSAIRGNAADNIQMLGNHASRIGEVALYAEFGFQGAMIANNIVDDAATGIAVTNFNEGGRLAVVQGNMIRNLKRREHEPVDKRGEGIAVEADCVVANNVIEGAPTAGLMIGWGAHLRDVVATGNLIRAARIGIAVSGTAGAGKCLIANNLISAATHGAIRAMDHATPIGADLIASPAPKHITLTGNVTN